MNDYKLTILRHLLLCLAFPLYLDLFCLISKQRRTIIEETGRTYERQKNNLIKDEELDKITGGVLLPEDKKWADEQMWKIIEEDGSWNEVADQVFPLLENYCNKVNKTNQDRRLNDMMHVSPIEMSDYMIKRFFELGDICISNGFQRPKK